MKVKILVISCVSIMLLLLAIAQSPLMLNTTRSLPPGVYWLNTKQWPKKGDYVLFCPANTSATDYGKKSGTLKQGICPGNIKPLMKKIVAIESDLITVNERGVYVNGKLQPYSKPLRNDLLGKKMPRFEASNEVVPKNKVLLLSNYHPLSFDGRYFGLIDESSIRGSLSPLITFNLK